MFIKPAPGAIAVLAIAVFLGMSGYSAFSQRDTARAQQAGATTPLTRSDVEAIIRDYLLTNPELMLDVQRALEARQHEERVASQKKALSEKREAIFSSDNQIEIGNPDASITIVEFFDYNCGYCQRALSDMTKFIESDPDVRFVLKEFPVLGEASLEAHKVSLAFSRLHPEKAAEFHISLLEAQGRKDGEVALSLAERLGADPDAIRSEMEKPFVNSTIREVYELADDLGISGTPSYVVGDEVVFGAVGFASLNKKVAAIKECGTATC